MLDYFYYSSNKIKKEVKYYFVVKNLKIYLIKVQGIKV